MSLKNIVNKPKTLWWVMVGASGVGMLASFIQTIERIDYAKHPKVPLSCDLNSIFSCSNVFDAWQSAVFGFSNSLMCIVFFAVTMGVAIAAASGSMLNKKLRLIMHFFAVFFLGFGAWYLWQSTYKIGYICVFCVFCYAAVIAMNWAWLKLNAKDIFTSKSAAKHWARVEASGADNFAWALWAIIIASMIALHFI